MKTKLMRLGLHVAAAAIAALVICGCPPETKNAQAQVRTGYWSLTEFSNDGKALYKDGITLNADGTVGLFGSALFGNVDAIEGISWEQNDDTFLMTVDDNSYMATVTRGDYLEGLRYDNSDLTAPIASFTLRFLSVDETGLPQTRAGHWKFVLTETGETFGINLNEDGSVEDSPVGASYLLSDPQVTAFRYEKHGLFELDYYYDNQYMSTEFTALVDSPNHLEGYFEDSLELGFTADYVTGVVAGDIPDDQTPTG